MRFDTKRAIVVIGLVAMLGLTAEPAGAKKPPKPPPDGGGGITNAALTFHAGSKVYILTADASQSSTLAGGGKTNRTQTTWLPDGTRVAFQREGEIYTVKTDGTGLTDVGWLNREYSYVTGSILLHKLAGDAAVTDLVNTQSLGLRATLPSHEKVKAPAATPDLDPSTPGYQGWIAYSNARAGEGEVDPDIHIARLTGSSVGSFQIDTTTITRLSLPGPQGWPEWSADATTIGYQEDARYMDEGMKLAVVSVTLGTSPSFGTPVVVHTASGGTVLDRPAVSPDGRWLAFTHRIYGGKSEILRVDRNGNGLRLMTGRINLPGGPHWNPTWVNDLD